MITSASNPTLKLVRKLLAQKRKREELGLFAVEGEDLVAAASAAGIEPIELLVAGETVEAELLAAVSTLAHPARVVGVYRTAALPREPRGGDARALAGRRSRQRRHAAARRGCVRRGWWRSRTAAPIRSAQRRCAPLQARSSAFRCSRSTTRPENASRSSPTARRRCTSSPSPAQSPSSSEPNGTACRRRSSSSRTRPRRSRRAAPPSRSTSPWPGRSRSTSAPPHCDTNT